MATIIANNQSIDLPDNSPIQLAAEELGVPFGCRNGMCATCKVEIEEGMENINEKNQAEKDLCPEPNMRLCCQAEIKQGTVIIKI